MRGRTTYFRAVALRGFVPLCELLLVAAGLRPVESLWVERRVQSSRGRSEEIRVLCGSRILCLSYRAIVRWQEKALGSRDFA